MAEPWWRPLEEEDRLSQGDIVVGATLESPAHPIRPLIKQDIRGAGSVWKESVWTPDAQGFGHLLARGRITPVVVLTHSCQLDKKERVARVIIAPVALAERIEDQKARDLTMAGRKLAFAPLPGVPTLGDCYADLRLMTTVDRKVADDLKRVATMTKLATKDLQMRLVGFLARDGVGRDPDER